MPVVLYERRNEHQDEGKHTVEHILPVAVEHLCDEYQDNRKSQRKVDSKKRLMFPDAVLKAFCVDFLPLCHM